MSDHSPVSPSVYLKIHLRRFLVARGGGEEQETTQVLQISVKIHRLYVLSIPHVQMYPRGNCRGSTDMPDLEKENTPLPKRRRTQKQHHIVLIIHFSLCTDIIINYSTHVKHNQNVNMYSVDVHIIIV